jgi:hypothetical protein
MINLLEIEMHLADQPRRGSVRVQQYAGMKTPHAVRFYYRRLAGQGKGMLGEESACD